MSSGAAPSFLNRRRPGASGSPCAGDRAFGSALNNGPFDIPSMLPITIATSNNRGTGVTAGGLIFISATMNNLIRAIDIDTGETLWSDELPGGDQANPLIVEVVGRQFVIIYLGGHHFMEAPMSDTIIAYGLPKDQSQ